MNDLLPWARFWFPVGEDTPFDRGGFLDDPEMQFADVDLSQPYALARERDTPVLVLFGEAGMGKTTAIRHESADDPVLDLGTLESVTLRSHFEREVSRATSGEPITVWLDSLDECRIDTPRIERILRDVISNIPQQAINRFSLRIVGRSVEDPQALLTTLVECWGEGAAKTLALCPLRECDARVAAEHAGINADAFLEAVHVRDVAHLARRPKTLFQLIRVYAEHSDFPATRWEIHEQAMRLLVSETQGRKLHVNLDVGTRMHIAGRIAVVSLLSQRNLISTADAHDAPSVSLWIDGLVGAEPHADHGRVTLAELRETLQVAGLFQHGDDGTVRFSHRSDAEFLAARYLTQSDLAPETIRRLIEYPADGSLPPQMAGLTGWIAESFESIRSWMMDAAPLAVLKSELTLTETERAMVVNRLLSVAREEGVSVHEPPVILARAYHPTLVEQLRPYLVESDVSNAERIVAVRLLAAADVTASCIPELVGLLRCEHMPWTLRSSALNALAGLLADADSITRTHVVEVLKPHAMAPPDNEARLMLKGAALDALWPEHLEAQELFNALMPRRQVALIGSYESFMWTLSATLTPAHLPIALNWVREQYTNLHQAEFNIRRLAGRIMRRAWPSLEQPEIREAFADAAREAITNHVPLFTSEWSAHDAHDSDPLDETDKRRDLVFALAERIDHPKERFWAGLQVLRHEDAAWLLNTIGSASMADRRQRLSDMFAGVFHWSLATKVINRTLELAGLHASAPILELQQALDSYLQPISLEDEEDVAIRREHHRRLQQREQQTEPSGTSSIRERLESALAKVDSGTPDAWIALLQALSAPRSNEWVATPIDELEKWSECSTMQIRQIHQVAARYVRAVTPTEDFLHPEAPWSPRMADAAGYAAWELLIGEGASWDCPTDSLPPWRGLLLTKPHFGTRSAERRAPVLQYLQRVNPDAFPREVEAGLRREARDGLRGSELLHDLGGVWSNDVADVLRSLAQDPAISEENADALWGRLLARGDSKARALLCSRVERREVSPAQRAATLLLEYDAGAVWDVLGPFLEAAGNGARDVLEPVLHRLHGDGCNPIEAGPWAAAELYAILERLYPRDPRAERAGGIMLAVDHADEIKGSILRSIVSSGRWDAVDALNWLRELLPGHDWLRRLASEARQKALEVNWAGNDPETIIELLLDSSRRVVQSDEHLLAVIEDTLCGLQDRLCGETPMAPFLWETNRNKRSKPKSEERISDFVHDHMVTHIIKRNLVIHREVQVRNLNELGIGERTDLLVDAIGGSSDDVRYAVVIEAKGDWHPNILTAMGTQLVEQYLHDGIAHCGLYLALWSDTKTSKFGSPEQLRDKLERQAAELSNTNVTIRAFVLDITLQQDTG